MTEEICARYTFEKYITLRNTSHGPDSHVVVFDRLLGRRIILTQHQYYGEEYQDAMIYKHDVTQRR